MNGIVHLAGGKNFNASLISVYQENELAVFYVRPYTQELKDDLNRLMKDASKVSKTTEITEKDGTYRVSSREKLAGLDFVQSFWGILFRRYMAESKYVCLDPITEEKYYGVIFSHQYIEPCGRKLAV